MSIIRNRGLAGDALNGTNNGLVRVEGPVVWMPGSFAGDDNIMSSPSYQATGSETSFEVIVGCEWDAEEVADLGQRLLTGGWILSKESGVLTARFRSSADSWFSMTAPAPTDEYARFKMTWDSTSEEFALAWESSAGVWSQLVSADVSGLTLDPAYSYSMYTGQNLFSARGVVGEIVVQVDGVVVASMLPSDIVDPAASSVGTFTVDRGSSGPVATIVPSGVEYINPDETVGANRIDIPNPGAGIGPIYADAGDDAVMWGLMRSGNGTGTFPRMWNLTGNAETMTLILFSGGGSFRGRFTDTNSLLLQNGYVGGVGPSEPVVLVLRLDRDAETWDLFVFDASGLVASSSVSAAGAVAQATIANQGAILKNVAGSVRAFGVKTGVGIAAEYDDTTLAALAAYLLNEGA